MSIHYWLLVFLGVLVFFAFKKEDKVPGFYDDFANCLTSNNVTMFGAYWCSHCQAQKKSFSDSWGLVNYVECSLPNNVGQTQDCINQGIRGYPTWIFNDGTRIEGEASFKILSEKTGCMI